MKNHMREGSRLWDYELLEELGRGQYGQVFKVRNKKDNLFYALKRVNISSCHEKEKIQAFRQIKALKLIKHPDIIEYYQSFLSMDNIYIVMEYAAKGDFSKIVQERRLKEKPFSEQQLWQIFALLAGAVKYLHEKGIIHRDLKLQNIFMTQSGKVKIGDLGMCKVVHQNNQLISTRVGTPIYFAPQIIQHQLYSYPVDIWALGCVFYFLATLQHPFKQATMETLPYYVIDRDPKPMKGHFGGYLINTINKLMTKNCKDRPDIFEVNVIIKNRQNPTPSNKIRVFDFKKLLMMKPDLQKLDQMKNLYQKASAKSKQTGEDQQTVTPTSRYNSTEIKNYRDLIKINRSSPKINGKIDINSSKTDINNPQTVPVDCSKPKTCRGSMHIQSTQLIAQQKKRNDKQKQVLSPIKTNGFGQMKQIYKINENEILNISNLSSAKQKQSGRNFQVIRQQYRRSVHS